MKIKAKLLLSAIAFLAAPAVLAQGAPGKARFVKSDVMTGYQESVQPPGSISSTGTGEFIAEIDDDAQVITFELTYSGLEGGAVTQAHIHFGARGTTGGISAFLCGGGTKPAPCPPAGTVTGTITPADVQGPTLQGIEPGSFEELVRAMRSGVTYVNVHTNRWLSGEIRGQIHDHNERQVK